MIFSATTRKVDEEFTLDPIPYSIRQERKELKRIRTRGELRELHALRRAQGLKQVAVFLTQDVLAEIDRAKKAGGHKNRSDALTAILRDHFKLTEKGS